MNTLATKQLLFWIDIQNYLKDPFSKCFPNTSTHIENSNYTFWSAVQEQFLRHHTQLSSGKTLKTKTTPNSHKSLRGEKKTWNNLTIQTSASRGLNSDPEPLCDSYFPKTWNRFQWLIFRFPVRHHVISKNWLCFRNGFQLDDRDWETWSYNPWK